MGPASRRVPRVFVYTERTVDGMGKYCTKKCDQLCHPGSFDSAQDKLHAARRAVEGSRQGFTLMELMVYIAIVGIVVIVAGQAFSNSTKMRVRTQSMLKASEVAENVAAVMKDDIAQMGAKSVTDASASDANADAFDVKTKVYIKSDDPDKDLSSYHLHKNKFGTGLDSLAVLRVNYSSTGEYIRTEKVAWFVRANHKLYRTCQEIDGTPDAETCTADGLEVEIAENVEKFSVIPAKPRVLDADASKLFPNYPDASKKGFRFIAYENTSEMFLKAESSPIKGASTVSLTNMVTNFKSDGSMPSNPVKHVFFLADSVESDEAAVTASSWKNNCKALTFQKGKTYELSLEMTDMNNQLRMFRPGVDHFAVGIRNVGGDAPAVIPDVPDFLIYPPAHSNGAGKRSVSFMTRGIDDGSGNKIDVTGCIVFTVSLFSPTVSLSPITLSNIQLYQINDGDYMFDETYTPLLADNYTPSLADKKNVKAFRIDMVVKKNGEGSSLNLVIPTPSNGSAD